MDLSRFTGMFVGIHTMLAMQTQIPEIAISDEEGSAFMTEAQNVMRHYSVETTQKTLDWLTFMGTAGAIYLPRIAAVAIARRSNRAAPIPRRTSHGGKVVHLHENEEVAIEEDGAFVEGFAEEGPGEVVN